MRLFACAVVVVGGLMLFGPKVKVAPMDPGPSAPAFDSGGGRPIEGESITREEARKTALSALAVAGAFCGPGGREKVESGLRYYFDTRYAMIHTAERRAGAEGRERAESVWRTSEDARVEAGVVSLIEAGYVTRKSFPAKRYPQAAPLFERAARAGPGCTRRS